MRNSETINSEDMAEVLSFLGKHPSPEIRTAKTIMDGYVMCIGPIKTICGAELMCSPSTKPALLSLVESREEAK